MSVVLDASAVLVLLLDDPGAEVVAEVHGDGVLSAVNRADVLSTLTDRGADVSAAAACACASAVRPRSGTNGHVRLLGARGGHERAIRALNDLRPEA